MKYVLNKKKREESLTVTNANELQIWIDSLYFNINDESFKDFSWDTPFVADYEINDENFAIMITTKNSLKIF